MVSNVSNSINYPISKKLVVDLGTTRQNVTVPENVGMFETT